MILQSSSCSSFDFLSHGSVSRRLLCPCSNEHGLIVFCDGFTRRVVLRRKIRVQVANANSRFVSCGIGGDAKNIGLADSARRVARSLVVARFSNGFEDEEESSQDSAIQGDQISFTNFKEDPIVDKLRTQLALWTWRKRWIQTGGERGAGPWPQVPTSFSLSLEKDLQRKESVEWVNMVLVKLWKVYRGGIENWLIGLLQPVIDGLKKPDYVKRVEIKQFSLGDEPLSVRNVERRTSRRVNDLQ